MSEPITTCRIHQWRSLAVFLSAEICFYLTAGSAFPPNVTAPLCQELPKPTYELWNQLVRIRGKARSFSYENDFSLRYLTLFLLFICLLHFQAKVAKMDQIFPNWPKWSDNNLKVMERRFLKRRRLIGCSPGVSGTSKLRVRADEHSGTAPN